MSTAVSIDSRTHDGTEPAAEHLPGSVGAAIESGVLPDRVWVYSNYHCNLECAYCLTESAPRSKRRIIGPEHMVAIAEHLLAHGTLDPEATFLDGDLKRRAFTSD